MTSTQTRYRRLTRRWLLGAGLAAGTAAGLLASPSARLRSARAAAQRPPPSDPFYKGICYGNDPFPAPYNPSNANTKCISFGSDPSYAATKPLWGPSYVSRGSRTSYMGRNDLQTIKNMGANLIRLYDWEPRNEHFDFLNTCQSLGIKVLAPASNYFLQPGGGFPMRDTLIPNLIRSFGNAPNNAGGTDYHPAIAGLTFGNEPFFHDFGVNECIEFTRSWVSIEQAQFPGFRRPLIGHPVDFGLRNGAQYPAWDFYTALLDGLAGTTTRDLQNRLFLSPNTTNDAEYLYTNAAGSGQGYVPLTHNQFQKPLLFTEISQDRTKPNYLTVVEGQLRESIAYGAMNPTHLLGICFFQFADKVWLCPTGGMCPSEGSFGANGHTNTVISAVKYVPADFTHTDMSTIPPFSCTDNELNVDQLTRNPVYDTVVTSYGMAPAPLPPPRR